MEHTITISYAPESIEAFERAVLALKSSGLRARITTEAYEDSESEEERQLRDEYAQAKGLKRARLNPDMLGDKKPLEFLRDWKASLSQAPVSEELVEDNDNFQPSEGLDLSEVPV